MAGQITNWGATQFLRSFWSRTATPPEFFYLALIKDVAPTSFMSGSELDEPTTGTYQRVEIPNTDLFWEDAGQPQVAMLSTRVDFIPATADWGTIRYWALCNAKVDGYIYATGTLNGNIQVLTGDRVFIAEGDLSFVVTPFTSYVTTTDP